MPALPLLLARWAVLSAAFVAVGSPWGPRVLPAPGLFKGAERSGSSLRIVPGDRAVLSGGVWNDPVLDAVYNPGAPMPDPPLRQRHSAVSRSMRDSFSGLRTA